MIIDAILFPIFLCLIFYVGVGALRLFGRDDYPTFFYLLSAILAIGSLSFLYNLWDGVASMPFYGLLAALLLLGLSQARRSDREHLVPMLAMGALLIPFAASMPAGYDAGLYHIPHQLWIRSEAVVLGLANLHGRYGFNSFLEYVSAPLWIDGQYFKLLAYMMAVYPLSYGLFLWSLWHKNDAHSKVIALLSAASVAIFGAYLKFGYASTDIPAGICFAIAFFYGFSLVLQKESVGRKEWFVIFCCSFLAIAFKPSSALLVVWLCYVMGVVLWHKRTTWPLLLSAAILPIFLGVIWLFRNYLISGCLLFPVSMTCVDTVWSQKTLAMEYSDIITAWARQPAVGLEPLANWRWFYEWWIGRHGIFILGVAANIILAAGLYVIYFKEVLSKERKIFLPGVLFVVGTLFFWFIYAPTPRFGIGAFMIAAPTLALVYGGTRQFRSGKWLPPLALTMKCLLILLMLRTSLSNRHEVMNYGMDFNLLPSQTALTEPLTDGWLKPSSLGECWIVPYCVHGRLPAMSNIRGYRLFKAAEE